MSESSHKQKHLDTAASAGGSDWIISKGPFQPILSCDLCSEGASFVASSMSTELDEDNFELQMGDAELSLRTQRASLNMVVKKLKQ